MFFLGERSGPLFYAQDREVKQHKLFFSAMCVHGVLSWYHCVTLVIIDTYIYIYMGKYTHIYFLQVLHAHNTTNFS